MHVGSQLTKVDGCCASAVMEEEWPQAMVRAGMPKSFVLVLLLMSHCSNIRQGQADLQAVELFAGDRAITSSLRTIHIPPNLPKTNIHICAWHQYVLVPGMVPAGSGAKAGARVDAGTRTWDRACLI